MLALVISLVFPAKFTFAKTVETDRPLTRIYISASPFQTLDEALAPFAQPPRKCVPRASRTMDQRPKPMTERQKELAELTQQKEPHEIETYLRCYANKNYQNYYSK